jgi:hypothetical protein
MDLSNNTWSKGRFLTGLISVALAVSIGLFGMSAAASASEPSVTLGISQTTIASGSAPVVTFVSSGVPAGAVFYLQRASSGSQAWQNVARTTADSGTAAAPADPAGSFQYRIVALEGNTPVAVSAPVSVTVTGAPDSCAICRIGHAVLPWLRQLRDSIFDYFVGKVIDWIGSLIGL